MIRKPDWLRISIVNNPNKDTVIDILKNLNLNTVCIEAICPNQQECFSHKTVTFMILGKNCTRDCGFCNVCYKKPEPIDQNEPERIALAVKQLAMQYIVITSVTRDDLLDGGAEHFANVIIAIRKNSPATKIEVLIPDFQGNIIALKTVADMLPDVISHNIETVISLYPQVRPQADYRRSLNLLKNIKQLNSEISSKSGIMLGLGETKEQVYELFDDLQEVGCDFLTIGQYLSPSSNHLPVKKYIEPYMFEEYGETARKKGFLFVASAPLVRSSYNAWKAVEHNII